MKVIRILDKSGDTTVTFDETDAEATAKAKKVFDEWMAKKLPAFQTKRTDGKADVKITSFDEIEDGAEVVLVPAIVAG
jgi:hypothetical protein